MGHTDYSAEVIVLGLGAMGAAALYQLAKSGVSAIGIDQFSPPHILGSTHGDTRVTRQAIGEGESYTPLSLRSYEIWDELERATGEDLLTRTGGLIITDSKGPTVAHGNVDFMGNTLRSAQKYNIAHEQLSESDIRQRYPQFKLHGNEMGYFEPNAGFLRPENCVRAQLGLAAKYSATIKTNERVLAYTQQSDGVRVTTDKATYAASKLILSAGPWVSQLLGEGYQNIFKVYRQLLYWFDVAEAYPSYQPENFPIYIWDFSNEDGGIYGFPAIDGPKGGLKVAHEQYIATTTPEQVKRTVTPQETDEMYERYVQPRLAGVKRECFKAVTCMYTVTPDSGFIIDWHPEHKDIILASPCSGHGFKHSAAIGETLAQLATRGQSEIDINTFSLHRFKD